MTQSKPDMLLWLSDARGIYIPRDFAGSFADRAKSVANVSNEQWAILDTGPDHEFYWEVWNKVTDDAIVTDENGIRYSVWQDGDCWLIPQGMEWNDDQQTYVWPDEQKEFWTCGSGRIELEIMRGDAESASHQGQCDDDVKALSDEPYIAKQLAAIDPAILSQELKEYGAWDETELADHAQNLQRILWLACGDIVDGNN